MSDEVVSIIVPIYNTADYLRMCIDSLINQTYKDIEIILVNDGSTDTSLDICQEYEKQYSNIKVVEQDNRGVSVARNKGIEASSGKYVFFVDSDDVIVYDAIESMHKIMKECNADIVSASMERMEKYRYTDREYTHRVYEGKQSISWALKEVSMPACAKLYKKSLIQKIVFEKGRMINEDGYFVFQCCTKKPRVVESDKIVYLYSFRNGSASRTEFSEKYLDILYFFNKKKEWIYENYPQFDEEIERLEIRTSLNMLQLLMSARNVRYNVIEARCYQIVKNHRYKSFKQLNRYEKRLYFSIKMRLYPIYKFIVKMVKA